MRIGYHVVAIITPCKWKPYELPGFRSYNVVQILPTYEQAYVRAERANSRQPTTPHYITELPMGFYDIVEMTGTITLDGKCQPTKFYEVVPVPGGGRFPTAEAAWNYLLSHDMQTIDQVTHA